VQAVSQAALQIVIVTIQELGQLYIAPARIPQSVQRISGEYVTTEPKTRAGVRVITLPGVAIEALRTQAEARLAKGIYASGGGSLVYANGKGEPLSQGAAAWHMRQACKQLSLLPRLTPHGLRHLHASLLLAEGLPLPEVSRRLGHANPSIIAGVYSHAMRDDTAAAQNIERALAK
jgi:integrase